jgi:hypothetical protein
MKKRKTNLVNDTMWIIRELHEKGQATKFYRQYFFDIDQCYKAKIYGVKSIREIYIN